MLVAVWLFVWTLVGLFFLLACCGIPRPRICASKFARCLRGRAAMSLCERRWCEGFWVGAPRDGEWDGDVVMITPFQHTSSSTLYCLFHAKAHARIASNHAA